WPLAWWIIRSSRYSRSRRSRRSCSCDRGWSWFCYSCSCCPVLHPIHHLR
ncbi:MAG: hypothetical protein AVDCRST_MAG78-2475, partial [uncultured Rubrobacteraceae bacterium]